MAFVSKLVVLSLVVAVVAFWWGSNFHVPDGLEQRGEVVWMYAACKISRILAQIGEKLGFGQRVVLYRKLFNLQILESRKQIYEDTTTFRDSFDGVEVLIIEPKDKDPYGPALVWVHGGGWIVGSADMDIEFLEELSRSMRMMIVSIEYRMAPEFPYPTPLEDCFIATKYFIENAIEQNVDPFRIAIGGLSAGGNLAAALSLKIRDSNLTWKNKVQILIAPCLQAYQFDSQSFLDNENDDFLPRQDVINCWMWYAFGVDGHFLSDDFLEGRHLKVIDPNKKLSGLVDGTYLNTKSPSPSSTLSNESEEKIKKHKKILVDPLYAPLMSSNFSGLPTTFIATAEFDVLRDDGLAYAKRLKERQIDTRLIDYKGTFHHLLFWNENYKLSRRVLKDVLEFLQEKL